MTAAPVDVERCVALYAELGHADKVALQLGISRTVALQVLRDAGVLKLKRNYSDEDIARLKRDYLIYRDAGKLALLAADMGRGKTDICTKARTLGLTDPKHKKPYGGVWKYMPEEVARGIFDQWVGSSLGLVAWCKKKGYDDLGFSNCMKRYFADEWDHVIELKQPKTGLYRLGRRLEYTVRDDLKRHGYFVLRSPQSRSPVDVVGFRKGEVIFVQCKRGGALGVADWNEFYDLSISVGAVPILASTPTGRGTVYQLLVGRKDGSKRAQPFVPYKLTKVGEAA